MFEKAFLEGLGGGKLRHEEKLLREEFERRGIPVSFFTLKTIQRRQLPLGMHTFIAGGMGAMHGAMRQLQIEIPTPNDYPPSLFPYMQRRVWTSSLGVVEQSILDGRIGPVFVKPADRQKSFTGRIFESIYDLQGLGRTSRREKVWCSEVVTWASEYRVYLIGERIVSIAHYSGDSSIQLNHLTLEAALNAFRSSGQAPSAYGIDFGVLSTGETALVEANDGYALGAYQISSADYTELIMTRWRELVTTAKIV